MYNSPVRGRALVVLSFFVLSCIFAQEQHTAKAQLTYKLISIRVKGLNHLNQDQVVTASGLKLGEVAKEADFKQALEKLGDTGLFTNLSYAYRYSTEGCNVDLQVSENDKLLPILFDNFVWFSDQELTNLLRARVPLFDGRLPEAGNLADQISDALNALLAERSISAKVDYLRAGPVNGPIDSYVYQIKFHPIVIRNVSFPGAAPAEIPALEAAAKPLSGQAYLRDQIRPQEKFNFLPVYLARGFLNAEFEDAQSAVVSDGPRTVVDISLPVHPGIQYKLKGMAWTGNTVFPAEKLQPLIHLKPGESANAVQLDQDLDAVGKLYGAKGYLRARVQPVPTLDDAQATVTYGLNVVEGDQYRMGDLLIDGIDQAAIMRILYEWQMKKGDPYDNTYFTRFFQFLYRDTTLSRSYNIAHKETLNPQDKTVALALHFVPK
jgi:outer membrane protein insertion porin family